MKDDWYDTTEYPWTPDYLRRHNEFAYPEGTYTAWDDSHLHYDEPSYPPGYIHKWADGSFHKEPEPQTIGASLPGDVLTLEMLDDMMTMLWNDAGRPVLTPRNWICGEFTAP